MRRFSRMSVLVGFIAMAGPAIAADPRTCRFTPDIVAAADALLVDPKSERRFWRDRFSDDAAYLLIRYGELSPAAALGLVDALGARPKPPLRLTELRLSLLPPAERRTAYTATAQPALRTLTDLSVLRAFVVDGEEDWLFADVVRRAAEPSAQPQAMQQLQVALARALSDLDHGTRIRVVARAEAHGLWRLALDMTAMGGDMDAWLATLRRSPHSPADPQALAAHFAPVWRGSLMPGIARPQRHALPAELQTAVDILDRGRPQTAGDFDKVIELIGLAPGAMILTTAINQTGEHRLGAEVAAPLVAGIREKRIDPAADIDRIRAVILAGTVRILGMDRARVLFSSFPGPTETVVGETALATLERALVRYSLAGFARGDEPAPSRPPLLSSSFDWSGWRNAAEAIRKGEPAPDSYRGVEAELLHAIGRNAAAINVLRAMGTGDEARQRAHTLLVALDQMCGGVLWPQAPLGQPLYRFPPRTR
jgi:hypothetical protein